MLKNTLQAIDNVTVWPVVSFVIFFLFFVVLLLWVFSVDKKFIEKMKGLPIEENDVTTKKSSTHETEK